MSASTVTFTNAFVKLNSVDLSAQVKSVTLDFGADMLDASAMGDTTHINTSGALDWSLNVEFLQSYAAGNVDATLFPLVGAAAFAIEIRPVNTTVGPTNPKFTGSVVLEKYQPLGGKWNDLEMAPVSFKCATALTRATA